MSRLRAVAAALTLGVPFVATAADITRVASSFEDDDPFGLFIDARLEYSQRNTKILREVFSTTEGKRQLIPELRYSNYATQLSIDVAAGISRDVEFSFGLPFVVFSNEYWNFADGRGTGNSTVTGEGLFKVPLPAYRMGLGNARFGLAWAIFNQKKDDTKPTWAVRLDYEAPTAKRLDPSSDTSLDENSIASVGDRVHKYTLSTALSREIGLAEPYFKAYYTIPVRGPGAYSNCEHPEVNMGTPANCNTAEWDRKTTGIDPAHVVGVVFGSEFVVYDQPPRQFTLDVRALGNYVSAGRYYNELSGALRKLLTTGDYMQVGGRLALKGTVTKFLSVRGSAQFLYNTDHALSDERPGKDTNDDGVDDVAGNPNYDPRVDGVSRRFYASQSKDLRLEATAIFTF